LARGRSAVFAAFALIANLTTHEPIMEKQCCFAEIIRYSAYDGSRHWVADFRYLLSYDKEMACTNETYG
jgi:hypothetical protein